jgi:2'-5' RNA ligase
VSTALRAFIAIPVPETVTEYLHQVQKRLDAPEVNIRWVKSGNIHLTLKFLGDIDPSSVGAIADQMDAVAGARLPFELNASGFGVFPNQRRARVLWVGLGGGVACLASLWEALEMGLATIGIKRDKRRFNPHLTIGRSRRRFDVQMLGASSVRLADMTSDSFNVDRLLLIKSVLKPTGAEYTPLHVSHLAK